MKRLSSLFVLLCLAVGGSVQAKVVYVNTNAPGPSQDGTSWATAFTTIQEGVTAAAPGDEVWVAASAPSAPAYLENLAPDRGIALYGGFAGGETQRSQRDWKVHPTVLDGSGSGYKPIIDCQSQETVVDGFRICNGFVGINVYRGTATISNNTISRNNWGVDALESTVALSNNIIVDNAGAGVHAGQCVTTLSNNVITANGNHGATNDGYNGVFIEGGTATLSSNTIAGNSPNGVYIHDGGYVTLAGNTISGNSSSGVEVRSGNITSSTSILTNNIIAFNGTYGLTRTSQTLITTFSHNDVYGNTRGDYDRGDYGDIDPPAGPGNISLDPKFSNPYHNIHLQPDSPCRDAGDDAAVSGATDIDGQPRVRGAHVDIGSDESDGTAWVVPSVTWHVSTGGDDANDGSTWLTAKRTVQGALAVAQGTDEVWVAEGTYTENIVPGAGVSLYGGFAGTEIQRGQRDARAHATVLDGSGETTVLCGGRGITIDGFGIRSGSYGVSVYNGTATISNNTFSSEMYEGVRVFRSTATISENSISGTKDSGIHLRTGALATVSRNTLSGNGFGVFFEEGKATLAGNVIYGSLDHGVFVNVGTASISNNVITGNRGSGVRARSGFVTLTNNTVSGNANDGVNVQDNYSTSLANNVIAFNGGFGFSKSTLYEVFGFSNNDVFGNAGGDYDHFDPSVNQGNLSVNPLFVDRASGDFHLQAGSPCIDAGDNSAVTPGSTDLDGKPRILGSHVDIGAYEYGTAVQPFTLADVTECLSIACGLSSASAEEIARLNVSENPVLDLLDATRLARKAAGMEANP